MQVGEDGNEEQQHEKGTESAAVETSSAKEALPSHLTTSGAASLASASSVPPPLLSRSSNKASASQAQGQKSGPTLLIDLTESTQRLRLSPSPSRPDSCISLTTEDETDQRSFQDDVGEESVSEVSPNKSLRSEMLTRRLKSAIGEDFLLQKDLMPNSKSDGEGDHFGGNEGDIGISQAAEDVSSSLPSKIRKDDDAQLKSVGGSRSGWGWSSITNLPSSLRVDVAFSSLRGSSSSPSNDASTSHSENKTDQVVASSTGGKTESSFGDYMKPLDVRRWWAITPTASSRSSSSERNQPSSRSGSSHGVEDNRSIRSSEIAERGKTSTDSPLKVLKAGSFPATSIAKKSKAKRESVQKEVKGKERELKGDSVRSTSEASRGRGSKAKDEIDLVEHDLSSHTFGVEGEEEEKFPEREYLVLSTAGKPIYISYVSKARLKRAADTKKRREAFQRGGICSADDEENARGEELLAAEDQSLQDDEDQKSATKVGVLQALISNYESLGMKELQQRSLDLLELPFGSRICYLLKPPLYLVAISRWGEEDSTLHNHLEHLYLAIISLVTASKLSRLFDRAANFDLKRLLDGTDGILDTLLTNLQLDATSLYGSLQPLRIETALRLDVGSALIPSKDKVRPQDALYALLISQSGIVTLARRKRKSIHPIDCHLLINTVYATKAMKEVGTQSWVPICLPKFASQGFLYAHVSFLEEEEGDSSKRESDVGSEAEQQHHLPQSDLALILVTSNPDGFEEMSQWRSSIIENLQSQNLLVKLNKSIRLQKTIYSADELRLPGLRHFIFKWRSNVQSTSPQFEDPYTVGSDNHKRLICLYGMAYHYIYRRVDGGEDATAGVQGEAAAAEQGKDKDIAAPSSPIIRPKSVLAASTNHTTTTTPNGTPDSPLTPSNNRKKSIPIGQHLIKTPSEIIFAWSTPPFELYVTVSPHLPQNAIINIAKSIVKWVKQEEHRLFIVSAPVF